MPRHYLVRLNNTYEDRNLYLVPAVLELDALQKVADELTRRHAALDLGNVFTVEDGVLMYRNLNHEGESPTRYKRHQIVYPLDLDELNQL